MGDENSDDKGDDVDESFFNVSRPGSHRWETYSGEIGGLSQTGLPRSPVFHLMCNFIISILIIIADCIILIITTSLFSFNHQVKQFAEDEPTEVDVVSEIEEIWKCCCFGQFAGFMNINSINWGFDMESMKCATGKSWFCIWQGENHIWLIGAKVFFWCFEILLKNPCVLSQLTYYEYFCRKIELVSLFFHPGPRWIWNREQHEKRSSWLFTQKMITRSTSTNSAKGDRHSLLDDGERGLNS